MENKARGLVERRMAAKEHSAASRNQEKTFGQDEQDSQDKFFLLCDFRFLLICQKSCHENKTIDITSCLCVLCVLLWQKSCLDNQPANSRKSLISMIIPDSSGFFAVLSGIQSDVWGMAIGVANPEGIESFSPALRGTSYAG